MNTKTDIERLHADIFNPYTWRMRDSGKTTIQIHQLAGQVQLGRSPQQIIVWMYQEHHFGYIFRMMAEIFREQEIRIIREYDGQKDIRVYYGESQMAFIRFLSKQNHRDRSRLEGGNWLEFDFDDCSYFH